MNRLGTRTDHTREARRRASVKAQISCEPLEDRQLLSKGLSPLASHARQARPTATWASAAVSQPATSSIATPQHSEMNWMLPGPPAGAPVPDTSGSALPTPTGYAAPTATAPAAASKPGATTTATTTATAGTTSPNPSTAATSTTGTGSVGATTATAAGEPAAVQAARLVLQEDMKAVDPKAKPSADAQNALQVDEKAVADGTLTGVAADAKLQADHAAVLASMGLPQDKVTKIQADQQALQAAITRAYGTSDPRTSWGLLDGLDSLASPTIVAARTALQKDLKVIDPKATPSPTAVSALQADLKAVGDGTLSAADAPAKLKADRAAILKSLGLTETQVAQIQADEQALKDALPKPAASSTTATTATKPAASTGLQTLYGRLLRTRGRKGRHR